MRRLPASLHTAHTVTRDGPSAAEPEATPALGPSARLVRGFARYLDNSQTGYLAANTRPSRCIICIYQILFCAQHTRYLEHFPTVSFVLSAEPCVARMIEPVEREEAK